jgi:large subunit ribosomal protein L15
VSLFWLLFKLKVFMQFHQLQRKNPYKKPKRVGRGGKRGTTSGRGTKGQRARAGRKIRPELRDTIKKLPKRRGYGKNRSRTVNASREKPAVVNLDIIERLVAADQTVTPQRLLAAGVIRKKRGRIPTVKILARGNVSRPIIVSGCLLSLAAKEKIKKVGGSVR